MKYIFLLSGTYPDLAKEEALSLFDIDNYKPLGKLLVVELKHNDNFAKLSKRLALTKVIYSFLFECKIDDLNEEMKGYDWASVYKDNFCLRIHNLDGNKKLVKKTKSNTIKKISNKTEATSGSVHVRSEPLWIFSEKYLAKYIWRSVKKPKVNLENPRTKIELFLYKGKAYCGLLIFENREDFESRKSHLRPFPSPSSLHPRLARALVNISGIKDGVLLDPFCGAGGFLIEAGLMNIKVIGYDINKIMIEGCRRNLEHFKINNYKIKARNALNVNDKFDYAVTDLPYGLNSNAMTSYSKDWKKYRLNFKVQKEEFHKKLEMFYLKFLKSLRKKLKKKAVIIFPNYVEYKKLLRLARFKIERGYSNYVHGSLTRKIVKIS